MDFLDWFAPLTDKRPVWLVEVSFGLGGVGLFNARDEVYVHAETEGEAKAAANRGVKRTHPGAHVVTLSVERITKEETA